MKTFCLIVVAAFLLGGHSKASVVSVSNAEAFENESVLRFWFQRDGDTNLVQTVEYFTYDGDARSGVHYVASTGTVTFAVGQSAASIEVPLIDNSLVDGKKSFGLSPRNPGQGMIITENNGWNCNPFWVGVIRDNELPPTRVDPLFVPNLGPGINLAGLGHFVAPMPDGRVLISGGSKGITRLQSNGLVDPAFRPGDAQAPWPYDPLHVFADGKILTWQGLPFPEERFVRLLPNGAVDVIFPTCSWSFTNPCPYFAAAQADGKILVISRTARESGGLIFTSSINLVRLNTDGTVDTSFNQGIPTEGIGETISVVALQADGRILVGGYRPSNDAARPKLVRLNPDGSPDNTFLRFDGSIRKVLVRTNGKILVASRVDTTGADRLLQLNGDGSFDPSFSAPPEEVAWIQFHSWIEQPDGRLLLQRRFGSVIRLNIDGSLDHTFTVDVHALPVPCQIGLPGEAEIALDASGQILVGGRFDQVDGHPRPGLVRLFDSPPRCDFRVMAPAEHFRSSGFARIRVVRTGPTTNIASVSFITRDDTAKAGIDYVSQGATLNFGLLEVSKEILVRLLSRNAMEVGLSFDLELSDPSAGYASIPRTPIHILEDLQLTSDSLRAGENIKLLGTFPGVRYVLESSTDLNAWLWTASSESAGSAVVFRYPRYSGGKQRFYRARRE